MVICEGDRNRFANRLKTCKVDAAVDVGVFSENSVKTFSIKEVYLIELEILARNLLDSVKNDGLTV